MHKKREFEVNL